MNGKLFYPKFLSIAVLTIGLLVMGGLNIQQKRLWVVPEDGCLWIQTPAGVMARVVQEDGPGARAGIEVGDVLKAINDEEVHSDQEVTRILYGLLYSSATYTLERNGAEFQSAPVVIGPPPQRYLRQRLFLEIVGIYFFCVGAFLLIKRPRAQHVTHFYFVCLISFVLFAYSYTGKLNTFDWTIFWLDTWASVFLPPLFLHFCLEFPRRKSLLSRGQGLLWLLYAPGSLLMLAWAAFVYGFVDVIPSTLTLRENLEALSEFHFGAYLVASAGALLWTYKTVRTPDLRQQMKWVTRGVALGVLPFFVLQALPRLLWEVPTTWIDAAILPLVLIPTSFGYAIHRYKLMDVDIIFKWGVTYTLATASVVTMIVLAGDVLGSGLAPVPTPLRVLVTILAAMLFVPIKDRFQIWLDKFFYGERYSARHTLVDFARALGAEIRSGNILDRIVDRLRRAFSVDRAAIFMESFSNPECFAPALLSGIEVPPNASLDFLEKRPVRSYLFFQEGVFGLHYFIPCRAKDRVIAYIGLGQTSRGDYLSSEDLELIVTMSDYVGIALENARLYQSLEQKVSEFQDLKDFNENIIESINVGVLVEDVDGHIAGWNKALESMTELGRSQAIDRRTADIIPASFLQRLSEYRHLYKQSWNGRTVNFSATSLLDKAGATRGRLIIIDDITDRVRLEDQLVQNERLTSIGLLAAGVAHEVNTPLAVISNYSQMLRKQMSADPAGAKILEKITNQTFRASEIVNSLLSFSRTHGAEFTEVNLHKVIGETLSLLEHPLKTAHVSVRQELQAESPATMGNAGKLQQVFLNLFLNARDAMPDGGTLDIRTRIADGRIEILISDSGSGISREHIKKIYDPFFTTKTAGKGTGLGLSVSYGIMQEHGGNISVESHVGRGTSFKLDFPLSRKAVNV
jgi:PAS domain S-box-containing protein